MKLADGHVHLFRNGYFGRYRRPASGGDDLSVYESLRKVHEIDLALVVGYEGSPRYAANNRYIGRLARTYRWVAPVAFTLPQSPTAPPRPFVGIALYLSTARAARAMSDWPVGVAEELARRHAIVSINAPAETLALAANAIGRLQGSQVLISHLGLPGVFLQPPGRRQVAAALGPLLSLSALPHIAVKLSGFYAMTRPMHSYPHSSIRPLVDRLVDAFGPDRLIWGSDFSPALDYVSFAQAVDALSELSWSQEDREKVMGGNLRRLIKAARRSAKVNR